MSGMLPSGAEAQRVSAILDAGLEGLLHPLLVSLSFLLFTL